MKLARKTISVTAIINPQNLGFTLRRMIRPTSSFVMIHSPQASRPNRVSRRTQFHGQFVINFDIDGPIPVI